MREGLTAVFALVGVGVSPAWTECPPEVDQFLTLNGESYKSSRPAVVRVRAGSQTAVARLGLRSNKCYSSLECDILQGRNLLSVRNIETKYFNQQNYQIFSLQNLKYFLESFPQRRPGVRGEPEEDPSRRRRPSSGLHQTELGDN